jgi:magnesium transporter
VIVDMAAYENGVRRPGELRLDDALEACREPGSFAWIGLVEPTEEEFDAVRREFDLHELAIEDAVEAHQRPKLEIYSDSVFVVLKTARYVEGAIETGEVQVFLGERFVITVRHGGIELRQVRLELEQRPELLRSGPGAVLYAVLDRVVDDYLPVIEAVDADIREVEAEVFSESRGNLAERIYGLKRQVLLLHDIVMPLGDPLEQVEAIEFAAIDDPLKPYFRDVADHVQRYARQIESARELLTNILSANLTRVSVRQNEDTRKISAWAAIIAVPTLVSGIYGMNFEHMPELTWTFGYPLALLVMALTCVVLYRQFKRAGWL